MRIKNYLLVLLLLSGVFSALAQDYDVKWRTLRNCTYNPSTNLVTKSGTNNWCSAEGLSCNYLLGGEDGYLDYRITGTSSTNQCFIGFNTYNDDNCAVIQYSFHQQGANYKVYENYVSKYTHNSLLQVGDTVRIERSGSNVYYWHIRNGTHTLKYTSTATVDPNDTLYVDFALYYNNSSLGISTASFGYMDKSASVTHVDPDNGQFLGEIDLTVDSAEGPLAFEWNTAATSEDVDGLLPGSYSVLLTDTLYGVDTFFTDVRYMVKWDTIVSLNYNATTNTLTNNSGNGWTHGALSSNKLKSYEDGYAGFTISALAANIDQFVGLSSYNTGAHYNTVEYGIYQPGTTVKFYESGSEVFNAGTCEIGDFYYVERSGTDMHYKRIRNGKTTLMYTSTSSIDPSEELYVDCSIYYNGYSVTGVEASFGVDWVKDVHKISDTTSGFSGVLSTGDAFGKSIVSSDINGDGFKDLLVAYDYNANDRGSLFMVSLDSSLAVNEVFDIIDSSSAFSTIVANDSLLGNSLKVLPDLDRDGKIEYYASAVIKTNSGVDENDNPVINKNQGKGYIFQLLSDGSIEWIKELAIVSYAEDTNQLEGPMIFDRVKWGATVSYNDAISGFDSLATTSRDGIFFGHSAICPGDIDGNGYKDLVVTAPLTSSTGTNTYQGGLKVLFLGQNFEIIDQADIDYYSGGLSNLPDTNDYMGVDIVALEDLNSNGRKEILVSGKNIDDTLVNGKLWLIGLNTDGSVLNDLVYTPDSLMLPDDQFLGTKLALVNDIDEDGVRDICVVSSEASEDFYQDGVLNFFSVGQGGAFLRRIASSYNGMDSLYNYAHFGVGLNYAGNLNDNGAAYLIAGATRDSDGGSEKGALYFLKLDDTEVSDLKLSASYSNVVAGDLGSFDLSISGGYPPYTLVGKDYNHFTNEYQFDILMDSAASQMSGLGIGTLLSQIDYSDYIESIDLATSWDTILPGIYSFVVYDSLDNFASVDVRISETLTLDPTSNIQNLNDTISKVQSSSDWVVINADNSSSYGENGAFSYIVTDNTADAFFGASANVGHDVPDAVLYYDLEGGSLKEYFGNGGDLVLNNGPITNANECGDTTGAYYMDGIDDYITVPDNGYFSFGSNDFTVTTWAKKISDVEWGNVVFGNWDTGGNPGNNEWQLMISNGNFGQNPPTFFIESGITRYNTASSVDVPLNTWAHLTGVRKSDSIFIYVNGVKTGSTYVGNVSVNDLSRDARIAKIYAAANRLTNVIVDEVGVYDFALSDEDISALYETHICDYDSTSSDSYISSLDFGILQKQDTVFAVFSGVKSLLSSDAKSGDEFEVRKKEDQVLYYKNGVLVLEKVVEEEKINNDDLLTAKAGILGGSFQITNSIFTRAAIFRGIVTNSDCADEDNGAIDLVILGHGPFYFNWVGPNSFTSSQQNLSGLEPGAYTVAVSNSFSIRTKRFWIGYPTFWENKANLDYIPPVSNNIIEATAANGYADSKNIMETTNSEFIRWVRRHYGDSGTSVYLDDLSSSDYGGIYTISISALDLSFVEQNTALAYVFQAPENRKGFHILKDGSDQLTYVHEGYGSSGPTSLDDAYQGTVAFNSTLETQVKIYQPDVVEIRNHIQSACFDFLAFSGYVELNKAVNEEHTPLNVDDHIRFVYYEDYVTDGNAYLSFSLVDESVGTDLSSSFSSQALVKGWNKFDLDISSMGLSASTYLLKVYNPKGDTYYLRFKID